MQLKVLHALGAALPCCFCSGACDFLVPAGDPSVREEAGRKLLHGSRDGAACVYSCKTNLLFELGKSPVPEAVRNRFKALNKIDLKFGWYFFFYYL